MYDRAKLPWHTRDMLFQSSMVWMRNVSTGVARETSTHTKDAPQFGIIVNMTRIQIVSDGPFEERGILRDDGESPPQVKQANCGDI